MLHRRAGVSCHIRATTRRIADRAPEEPTERCSLHIADQDVAIRPWLPRQAAFIVTTLSTEVQSTGPGPRSYGPERLGFDGGSDAVGLDNRQTVLLAIVFANLGIGVRSPAHSATRTPDARRASALLNDGRADALRRRSARR